MKGPDYTDATPTHPEYTVVAAITALVIAAAALWYLLKLPSDRLCFETKEYQSIVRWINEDSDFKSHLGRIRDYRLATNLWLGSLHRYRITEEKQISRGYFTFHVDAEKDHGFYKFDFVFDQRSGEFISVDLQKLDM